MDRLRAMVDTYVDPALFVNSCEHSILQDTYRIERAKSENNRLDIVLNASNIARRANRIIQIAAQEMDNSEEAEYVMRISHASNCLKQSKF